MKVVTIDKDQWTQGLEQLRSTFRLFGPIKDNGQFSFQEMADGQAPQLDYQNTGLSPKALMFPQSEVMMTCSLDEQDEKHHVYEDVERDKKPSIVLGLRPCDAKAMTLVKMNFDTEEYQDPYWLQRYNSTTFVGLACDVPCSTCFCTTAGCGPYHEEGLDALMVNAGDQFLIKSLSEKGDKLIEEAGWPKAAENKVVDKQIAKQKAAAEAKIISKIDTDSLASGDTLALYNADFWEDVAFACINCGTCTFTCPTCWCFDIQDEVYRKKSERMRNWDSCMFPIFTIHTTGHNPRGTKVHRVRQRFMHKLKYFVDKYESGIMCVGCGRCVRQCPVNIDIRRVSELMNKIGAENKCAVEG
jgi:sulfhydrogenase subunit beta (sulfur reductase)